MRQIEHSLATDVVPSEQSLLAEFIAAHQPLFVLTGAGCSTGSGIPDYRDREGAWKRRKPIDHSDFLRHEAVRRRYWARSLVGWPAFGAASPNRCHHALATLEAAGLTRSLVTQNVDGLHQRAGNRGVIELHGNLATVVCMDCRARQPRSELQARLATDNPGMLSMAAAAAPDGDADLETDLADFRVPACLSCGGILKPDVVFYGDTVPRVRVDEAMAELDAAAGMLVVGSSLMVYSGYRFCVHARATGKPIAAVNLGRTRADELLALKVDAACDAALDAALATLSINPAAVPSA